MASCNKTMVNSAWNEYGFVNNVTLSVLCNRSRSMKKLRMLVADDHEIVRRGLVSLLKSHAGWEICGEALDGRQAVDQVKQLRPDIVILDIGMPNLNGLEAARK